MQVSELIARESIRDLIARYNANGDSGRIDRVLELFADDAEMATSMTRGGELVVRRGHAEISTIFTGRASEWGEEAAQRGAPAYVRHNTSTIQIELIDDAHARSYCYFYVLMAHGLDHWGRYFDEFTKVDGVWKFSRRVVRADGSIRDRLPIPAQ